MTPFQPTYGSGQTLTATAVSASTTLPTSLAVRVINTGTAAVYIRIGRGALTATTADLLLPPGICEVLTKTNNMTTLAYVSPSGTTLNVIAGEGS